MSTPEASEEGAVYVDFVSKTVVLLGRDMIDRIIGLVDGISDLAEECTGSNIDQAVIEGLARGIAKTMYPDKFNDDEFGWSLGAQEEDIDYLMSKLPADLGPVQFTVGEANGAV